MKVDEKMIGSPEWFYQKSTEGICFNYQKKVEDKRAEFIELFSVEKLRKMNEEELLQKVFGNGPTMMEFLDCDYRYMMFGSTGSYKYLRPLYRLYGGQEEWKSYDSAKVLSHGEALVFAVQYRDSIVECINTISHLDFGTIKDYEVLHRELMARPSYLRFAPMLKYYQMIFPQFFPAMYADGTLTRAIKILGLKQHAIAKRIVNAGELSLFIRRCNVNNIVFNKIYEDQWGWAGSEKTCENAAANYADRMKIPQNIDLGVYRLPANEEAQKQENLKIVQEIEESLETLCIEGEEKEAVVKVRVNQGAFRDRLIKRFGQCCLCNVSEPRMLIASHIKPWAVSEASEKLDIDNGFLMCPNHDKLFDQGWITFDNDGKIFISNSLKEVDRVYLNVNPDMKIHVREGNKKYLEYHRENVFIH